MPENFPLMHIRICCSICAEARLYQSCSQPMPEHDQGVRARTFGPTWDISHGKALLGDSLLPGRDFIHCVAVGGSSSFPLSFYGCQNQFWRLSMPSLSSPSSFLLYRPFPKINLLISQFGLDICITEDPS